MRFNYVLIDEENYPHLFRILANIIADNYGDQQQVENFPVPRTHKLPLAGLETTASTLNDEEKWSLAAGDEEEQEEIYERSPPLETLWLFLNRYFNDELDRWYG